MTDNKKVVLAYSGGLDTSYCALYLSKELNMEVHTVLGNTGGFTSSELKDIALKAKNLGVNNHLVINLTNEYYHKCIKYMIMGNVLKNNTYPLSVSSERAFQAMAIAQYAHEIKADYIAHGSTGAGNDQVRFDLIFKIMAPNAEIITPTRDMGLSREFEINYLKKNGVDANFDKMEYSINAGLWGTSIGGKETLTSHKALPESAYPSQLSKFDESELIIAFREGEIVSVNNKKYDNPVEAIQEIENLASPYAIGRDMHIGDTIIGTKGRVAFQAAAALIIIKAHETLEKHTLTKWQMYWKEQLSNWYGMLLHEVQYLEPVMRNIETFLLDSQKTVNGEVIIKLAAKRFEIQGIKSPNDLMNDAFGQYGEKSDAWTPDDVKGFTNILANSMKIYHSVNS